MTETAYVLSDLQEAWLVALESGEYAQGFNLLQYQDRYCVIGVACDVVDKSVDDDVWLSETLSNQRAGSEVVKAMKFKSGVGHLWSMHTYNEATNTIERTKFGYKGSTRTLAALNDQGAPFSVLAEFVRNNPREVWDDGGQP